MTSLPQLAFVLIPVLAASGFALQETPPPLFGHDVLPMAGAPQRVLAADVRGDSRPELLLTKASPSSLDVLAADGSLVHSEPLTFTPRLLTALHANDDAHLDVLVHSLSANLAQLLLGDGTGDFTPMPPFATPHAALGTYVADYDGDGDDDVLVSLAGFSGRKLQLLRSTGDGQFLRKSTEVAGTQDGEHAVALADVDGVPPLDAVLSIFPDVVSMAGQSDGTFAAPVPLTDHHRVSALAVADVTDDGLDDLLIAGTSTTLGQGLDVLAGLSGGGFGAPVGVLEWEATFDEGDLLLHDWTADGLIDVVYRDWRVRAVARGVVGGPPEAWEPSPTHTGEAALTERGSTFGDVDGDGMAEIITLRQPAGSPNWQLDLTHLPPHGDDGRVLLHDQPPGSALVPADMNADGLVDLVSYGKVYLAQGDGSFTALPPVDIGPTPRAQQLTDLDADGDLDLLVLHGPSAVPPFLGVFLNDGAGHVAFDKAVSLATTMSVLAVGDVNSDGVPDVLLGASAGDAWQLLPGPAFVPQPSVPASLRDLTLADMDDDGALDLVVLRGDGLHVDVSLGDGLGGFAAFASQTVAPDSTRLLTGDRDGDGELDVFCSGRALSVLPGLGDGSLGAASLHPLPFDADGLHAADLDADGRLELITWESAVALLPGDATTLELSLAPVTFLTDITALDVLPRAGVELVLSASTSTHRLEALSPYPLGPWVGLGAGLPVSDRSPALSASGRQVPGEAIDMWISAGPARGMVQLVLGVAELAAPFKGGTLVPSPDIVLTLPLDARGSVSFGLPWPDGLSGLTLWWQAWMADGAAPLGFAASNALRSAAP